METTLAGWLVKKMPGKQARKQARAIQDELQYYLDSDLKEGEVKVAVKNKTASFFIVRTRKLMCVAGEENQKYHDIDILVGLQGAKARVLASALGYYGERVVLNMKGASWNKATIRGHLYFTHSLDQLLGEFNGLN